METLSNPHMERTLWNIGSFWNNCYDKTSLGPLVSTGIGFLKSRLLFPGWHVGLFSLDLLRKQQLLWSPSEQGTVCPLQSLATWGRRLPFCFLWGFCPPHSSPSFSLQWICYFQKGGSSNPVQIMGTPNIMGNVKTRQSDLVVSLHMGQESFEN